MQGYRRYNTPSGGYYALDPCLIERLVHGGKGLAQGQPLQAPFLQQPIVPVSPGHVRPSYPYPPSRRRRR